MARVLVVDDEPAVRRALERALRLEQHDVVLAADGEKLSKQNGAKPLELRDPLTALNAAASVLGLQPQGTSLADALAAWVPHWPFLQSRGD